MQGIVTALLGCHCTAPMGFEHRDQCHEIARPTKADRVRQCCDCRSGEHENLDNDTRLVTVRDPDAGRLVLRGYLCAAHRSVREDDGYTLHR